MNRSQRALGHAGLMPDGGRPGCPGCGARLEFGTDGQGRTTERCVCGYSAYAAVRTTPVVTPVAKPLAAPVLPPALPGSGSSLLPA